ncbi:MAG: hypothetical protein DRJ40_08410 [Thermoprotei archaeon]|nr:MAG: hypothetical protein DRJ40_08410 [Thermoprotei archaeon]
MSIDYRHCGDILLSFRDRLHDLWSYVQQSKREVGDRAYLPKGIVDEYKRTVQEALKVANECINDVINRHDDIMSEYGINTHEDFMHSVLKELTRLFGAFESWAKHTLRRIDSGEETKFMGMWHYEYPKEEARELLLTYMNATAFNIHQLALQFSFMGERTDFYGCVAPEPLIRAGVSKLIEAYCKGAQRDTSPPLVLKQDTIQHRLGVHASTIRVKDNEVEIEYLESIVGGNAGRSWRERMEFVKSYLESEVGLRCEERDQGKLYCRGKVSEDDMVKIALLFSNIRDLDLLPPHVFEKAVEKLRKYLEETFNAYKRGEQIWLRSPVASSEGDWYDLVESE